MKTTSFLTYNFFGILSKILPTAIPYLVAFVMSTPARAFPALPESINDQETIQINEDKDAEVSPTPVYLDKDLLPEMTMTFSMGKNGEVLFISTYGRRKSCLKGRASQKRQKLRFEDMLSSD